MSPSNESDNDDKSSDVLVSKLRDEIEYLSSRVLDYEEEKDELAAKVEVLQVNIFFFSISKLEFFFKVLYVFISYT